MLKITDKEIADLAKLLEEAESVLLGAGSGLSSAADPRFDFGNQETFAQNYPGLLQYGFKRKADLMGFGIYQLELQWGYYLANVYEIRYTDPEYPIYNQLLDIMNTKDNYFVMTTNVDALFERSGFPVDRIYTPQGDYARMQCLVPCTDRTWDTRPFIDKALPKIDPKTQMITDPDAIPKCPNCGTKHFFMNVRGSNEFIHKPYEEQAKRYRNWIKNNEKKKLLVIDIGSGFNTPVWIRWSAEQLVHKNPNASLIRINLYHPEVPVEIAKRSYSTQVSAKDVIESLWKYLFSNEN